MKDLFSKKYELNSTNIEKYAPELPGVIILYNKNGIIDHLAIANDNLKSTLFEHLGRESAVSFTFRIVKADV
jgi:hypothetical protein